MRLSLFIPVILPCLALGATPALGAVNTIIDDFHNPYSTGSAQLVVTTAAPNAATTETLTAPAMAGVIRQATLAKVGVGGTNASSQLTAGFVTFANNAGVSSTLTLDYDFDPLNNGSSVDLTALGINDSLMLEFAASDLANTMTIQLQSLGGGNNTQPVNTTFAGPFPPNQIRSLLFSSFAGVNPTKITQMTVTWSASVNAYDGALKILGAGSTVIVPEPSAALLALAGAMGLGLRRRRL